MTDLEVRPDLAPAPTTLFASDDPAVIVARATRIAETIAPVIRSQNLWKRIGASEHVFLEGWTLAGSMLGVFATTVRTWEIGDDQGYGATVEARTINGALVGRADAVVMRDEEVGGKRKWLEAPAFQLISMAQTRGSSKALRMPLGFVMKLAGYETTPAEEMEAAAARGETVSGGHGVRPGWRDIAEQQREHARLGAKIDEHGLRPWVTSWCDSKGYERPMAKAQFNQLDRAIDRELAERAEQSGGLSAHTDTSGDAVSSSPPDPMSGGGATRTDEAPGQPGRPSGTPPDPNGASTPGQEEAEKLTRSGAEGHQPNGRSGVVPPDDATAPPESTAAPVPPGRRSSGGPNRSGRGGQPGASRPAEGKRQDSTGTPSPAGTDEAEQAAFEQGLAADDPGRFTR